METEKTVVNYEWEDKQDSTGFKVHMIAGSLAGIAEHTVMLPFDNVKVFVLI
jgi:hypothetical protein